MTATSLITGRRFSFCERSAASTGTDVGAGTVHFDLIQAAHVGVVVLTAGYLAGYSVHVETSFLSKIHKLHPVFPSVKLHPVFFTEKEELYPAGA